MTTETSAIQIHRRFLLVAVALPVLATAVAGIVQLAVLSRVPDQIAINWGPDGRPDTFVAAWWAPVATAVLGFGTVAILGSASLPGLRRGDRGPTYRFMGALSASLTVFVGVLLTWIVVMQAGLADATAAPGVVTPLLVAFVSAAVIGVAAWFLQPRQAPVRAAGATVQPLDLAPTERAVWMRETSMKPIWVIAVVAVVVLALGSTIVTWLLSAPFGVVIGLAALTLASLVVTATATVFRVRVSDDGLEVASAIGFPRFRVPYSDIRNVDVAHIEPVGDFGGWGLRWRPDRFGVITRAGEAIAVRRRSGRTFVVTVDDADTGAALLHTLASRHQPGHPDS